MKMYAELSRWWPLLSTPADYEEEAAFYHRALVDAASIPVREVLELGSGGGNNASWLKRHWTMTLVDVSPGMLDVSRALNPGCEHIVGDMRDVRLGRAFDAVFVHDAVCYMTTEDDLRRAIETVRVHLRPGGAALFAPDFVRETFRPWTNHGGHDGADGRALRYLEWTRDPDPDDDTYLVDYTFHLLEPDGTLTVEHDRHVEGLFSTDTWLRLLREAGLDPRALPFEHTEVEGEGVVFVGQKQ